VAASGGDASAGRVRGAKGLALKAIVISANLDMPLATHYAVRMGPDGAAMASDIHLETKVSSMPDRTDSHHVSLVLPERTIVQLDELVRHGHFSNRQEAMVAAVERLHTDEETRHVTTRQAAFARLCGALQLGTTRASLRQEELDRLTWESTHRSGHGLSTC
jgi:Arc/MetJ-type ribon-helix-helix transcriptional regulator